MKTIKTASSTSHRTSCRAMDKFKALSLLVVLGLLAGCGGDSDAFKRDVDLANHSASTSPTVVVDLPTTDVPVKIGEDALSNNAEASALVGLSEEAALLQSHIRGWVVRVVARDGEIFAVTMDYSAGRVNLTIVDGVVSAYTMG